MPIKIYETLEEIPEPLREAAIETKDGKFAAEERDEIGVLKATVDAVRREKGEIERQQREAKAELTRLQNEAAARRRGETEEDIEKRRKDIDAAVQPLKEQIAERDKELRKLKHSDKVRDLAIAAGIMKDRIEDAMLVLERRTDLTADGKGLVVLERDGTVSATRVEDFLANDFKAEKPWFYSGTNSSGSGTRPSGTPVPTSAERQRQQQEQLALEKKSLVSQAF